MSDQDQEAPEDTRVGLIGKTLGRYRVTAELGRGGMATVYRATDTQLHRDVAVKVMHGTFAGRGDLEARFRREAQAVAAIKHDGIVNIFDFAPAAGGEPGYIVTEIVEGPTLRALLERQGGRLFPELAVAIAARVAAALGAAHARGIVHRDVKPDNVMLDLGRAGGQARVLLTDFGVAYMIDADTMTATGAILGSPTYMSPEQARGQPVGKTSDVFSLGVMLYHLVTGRPPFAGSNPLVVIAAILRGELQRPSQLDARVAPALEAVILRCLEKTPERRYPDAGAAAAALAAIWKDDIAPTVGVAEPEAAVRLALDDPAAFEAALRPRVAEQAFQQARRHARRGELGRALAAINRALAYEPAHAGASALLASIGRRRRAGTIAAVVLGVAALGGIGYGVRQAIVGAPGTAATRAGDAPVPTPPAVQETRAPATKIAMAAADPARTAPPPVAAPVRPAVPPAPRPGPRRRTAPVPPSAAPAAVKLAEATTAVAGGPPTPLADEKAAPAAPPAPPPATQAAPPAPAPAPAARLVLRASQGFCSPSLDDHAPSIHPTYDAVPPGVHRIYCTLPLPLPRGTKVLVGSYELRPGARSNLVIVPGPDGKPTLGRTE